MIDFKSNFTVKLNDLPSDTKPFNMIWIDGGEYLMGVPPNQQNLFFESQEKAPFQQKTKISRGYWIGQYPVTELHWNSFLSIKEITSHGIADLPIHSLTWLDAMLFCKELNSRFKDIIPEGYHFSLPTELHWEYACCANEEPINILTTEMDRVLRSHQYSNDKPYLVGQKEPNKWNIYDMLGNVSEWCYDITEEFSSVPCDDWVGNMGLGFGYFYDDDMNIIMTGEYRSVRGTELLTSLREHKICGAGRLRPEEERTNKPIGFRVCLRPITEWDLKDPLLKKEGINILGDI